ELFWKSVPRWTCRLGGRRDTQGRNQMKFDRINRRIFLKSSAIVGAGLATPTIFTSASRAQDFCNAPTGSTVTLGFNVPQTGPYAEEGADQLKAYQLAVKHLNGEGDGGM